MRSPVARATSVETKSSVVRCRPDPGLWIVVVLLAPMGVAMLMMPFWAKQPKPSEIVVMWLLCGMIAALFLALPAALAWWLLRAEIVADGETLCWRNFGRRRCARWEEVSDFYDCSVNGARNKKARVETDAGGFTFVDASWKNSAQLRDAIQERATAVTVRHWALKGARDEDEWPRRFDYDTPDNRRFVWIIVACSLMIVVPTSWMTVEKVGNMRRVEGADWPIIAFPVFYLLIFSLIFIPIVLMCRDTRRRRSQQIIATPDELQFHDGDVSRVLKWDEITDYYSVREGFLHFVPRLVVESRRAQIDFAPTIKERTVLQEIIRRHAHNVVAKDWAARDDEEVLGGDAAHWSGGALGMGKRIYHYRTRTNRAMLWLPSALFVIFLLLPFFITERPFSDGMPMIVLAGIFAFWGWWRFYRAAVLVGGTSIVHRGALGECEMEWSAVREYCLVGGDALQFIELKSDAKRLRFWFGVADLEELKSEISRRAVNSTTREWNEL